MAELIITGRKENGGYREFQSGDNIAGWAGVVTHALSHLQAGSDPIPLATALLEGLMSSTDKAKLDAIGDGPLQLIGAISVAADFPTPAAVQKGWTYVISANVTDNDPTKTNTGDSFLQYDEIAWDGSGWILIGNTETPAVTAALLSILTVDGQILMRSGGTLVAVTRQDVDNPIHASSQVLRVDPNHPYALDNSNVKTPFLTIMGAMATITSTPANHVLIDIAPGVYDENVVVNYSKVHLKGAGFSSTEINPSVGDALTYRPVDAATGPWDNRVHDLLVRGDVVVNGETAPASGIFYPSMCGNELMFVDCSIVGDMTFDHANYLSAQGIFVNGNVSFTQCTGQWWNFSEVRGTVTLAWSSGDPNPLSDNSNYGWSPYGGVVTTIILNTEGAVLPKNHVVGTLTLNTALNVANLNGCPVKTLNNPGAGTVINTGDYYDNTVSGLVSTDVQAAIDELAAAPGGGWTPPTAVKDISAGPNPATIPPGDVNKIIIVGAGPFGVILPDPLALNLGDEIHFRHLSATLLAGGPPSWPILFDIIASPGATFEGVVNGGPGLPLAYIPGPTNVCGGVTVRVTAPDGGGPQDWKIVGDWGVDGAVP